MPGSGDECAHLHSPHPETKRRQLFGAFPFVRPWKLPASGCAIAAMRLESFDFCLKTAKNRAL